MTDLDIRIDIEENVSAAFARGKVAGRDMTLMMAEISEVLVEGAQERFDTQIGPDGVPWKKSGRAEESSDNPPTLTLTGQLRRQIVPDYGPDFARAGVLKTGGPGVYARIHQLGGTIVPKLKKALSFGGRLIAKVIMPARAYLGFGEFERAETTEILKRHISQALEGGR